jgi:ribonuclease P protein component
MSDQKFPGPEKLKSRKLIQKMFSDGKSHFVYPIKWVYIATEPRIDKANITFTVSVSKKTFKRAVDRNLIKRRIREAYRLHKSEWLAKMKAENRSVAVMAVYVGKVSESYALIEHAVKKLISINRNSIKNKS